MSRKALITGITGQDGAYLTRLLLSKGYEVHGVIRKSSQFNTQRIEPFYQDKHSKDQKLFLHYGDSVDGLSLLKIIEKSCPDEIYNLGAQSHVKVSFELPEYTANVDGLGCLRILDSIRTLGMVKKVRFYQASTSELYGKVQETPQSEKTQFYPRSPYASAKLAAYWFTVNYRESYGLFGSNGILFNHESPFRNETFVTRKITRAVAHIALGFQDCLYLGNLDAKRDWGHASEYVEGMWKMLQTNSPNDYVLATGVTTSIRDFLTMSFTHVGVELEFRGKGVDETAVDLKTGKTLVRVDPTYYRPNEVELLQGDASKAHKELNWKPKVKVDELCKEMVYSDLYILQRKHSIGCSYAELPNLVSIIQKGDNIVRWLDQNPAKIKLSIN